MIGSIDWLTTVIGIAYFRAVEGNPFIASLANTNLLAFTVVKLGTAFFVALLFYQVEKILGKSQDEGTKISKGRAWLLRGLQAASAIVLVAAVINNISVIANAMA